MKLPICLFLVLLVGCDSGITDRPIGDPVPAETAAPVAQPKSPVPYSTTSPSLLHDLLRGTMRDELGFTISETNPDGTKAKKAHSFEIREENGRLTWVIKIKWFDTARDKIYAGSDYLMLWDVVDKNTIEIINSPDGTQTALRIRPTQGNTFLYHPYTKDPDVAVNEAIIGWFDHSQDATLLRAYTYMHQLADNMDKWGK